MKITTMLIGIMALLIVAGCVVQVPTDKDRKTVSTSGTATVSMQPDEAVVLVVVETLAKTGEASKNKNSEITDKVYAALYKINVPRENIETQYFNMYEEFDWTERSGRKSLGFKTVHNLKIKTSDFKNLGKVIDAVVDAGATRIDMISFDLSDAKRRDARTKVLEEASKNAREKAEAIASGVGVKLGDIVSVDDASYDYRPYPMYEYAKGAALDVTQTEISPQTLEVSGSVQVTWEIK